MTETLPDKNQTRARKLPAAGTKSAPATVRWQGRVIPLVRERGMWRLRSRAKDFPVNANLGTSDLATAREAARKILANREITGPATGTLEEAVTAYLAMPKKCNDNSAAHNITRLRSMVRQTWGKELDAVKVERLPELWPAYVAKRQGRTAPDYSLRSKVNHSINAALKQSAAIFRKKLEPHYRRAGVILPADAGMVEFLPAVAVSKPETNDTDLLTAWGALRQTDVDMWLAVGLARFAGLRLGEILAARGKWFEKRSGCAVVRLMDREEDGYRTKTGATYTAVILSPALAEYVLALAPEAPVISRPDAALWIAKKPQDWLRSFVGKARLPLHRLRGLYADQIKRETEQAILARAAGVKAAQEALGHTTSATTERHYLSGDE